MNSLPGLPGNPNADALKLHQDFGNTLSPTVQATLALAHEHRTATLVNVVRMYADLGMAEQAAGIIDAITNRLEGYGHE